MATRTWRTRRRVFVAIALATLAAACWERLAQRNYDRATCARQGDVYQIEMRGLRFPLVHDPLSLVLARTREDRFTLELPRIEGVIDGKEIVRSGSYRYLGSVVITNGRMKVDLYFPDEDGRRALSWNDEYTLVPKESNRAP